MRGDNPSTVLAHGCFDVLHAGHLDHLREARKLGDRLVVSVTADKYVGKGAGRPHFTAQERAEHLRSLSFVDEVLINDAPTAVPMIEKVRPAVYVKGSDYLDKSSPGMDAELAAVAKIGGKMEITLTGKLSSSRLLTRFQHGPEVDQYLANCRERQFWPKIAKAFDKAKTLKVVFVGETIIDEYRYVAPLGKPSKEFILAVADQGLEKFEGGVVAAARHAEKICQSAYVTQPEGEIKKTRFIGKDFGQKLFEVYSIPTLVLSADARRDFRFELDAAIHESDVAVVVDFGHGLIDDEAIGMLRPVKFLAVNAQSNAGNQGFNRVTKYRYANYVCVDAPEARLAVEDQHGPIEEVIESLGRKMMGGRIIVTHGKQGAYWDGGKVPAFSSSPKDTIGAGDCFLAITAPLIAAGLGTEEAALVGNVAGAMKTEIMGHRAPIDGDVLYQTVKSLLK